MNAGNYFQIDSTGSLGYGDDIIKVGTYKNTLLNEERIKINKHFKLKKAKNNTIIN